MATTAAWRCGLKRNDREWDEERRYGHCLKTTNYKRMAKGREKPWRFIFLAYWKALLRCTMPGTCHITQIIWQGVWAELVSDYFSLKSPRLIDIVYKRLNSSATYIHTMFFVPTMKTYYHQYLNNSGGYRKDDISLNKSFRKKYIMQRM